MKKIFGGVLFGAASTLGLAEQASAQAVANYGNYEALKDNFRIGIRISAPLFGLPPVERSFEQGTIEDIETYLDPREIAAYLNTPTQPTLGTFYAQFGQIDGVFDIQGAPVIARYGANGRTLRRCQSDAKRSPLV